MRNYLSPASRALLLSWRTQGSAKLAPPWATLFCPLCGLTRKCRVQGNAISKTHHSGTKRRQCRWPLAESTISGVTQSRAASKMSKLQESGDSSPLWGSALCWPSGLGELRPSRSEVSLSRASWLRDRYGEAGEMLLSSRIGRNSRNRCAASGQTPAPTSPAANCILPASRELDRDATVRAVRSAADQSNNGIRRAVIESPIPMLARR